MRITLIPAVGDITPHRELWGEGVVQPRTEVKVEVRTRPLVRRFTCMIGTLLRIGTVGPKIAIVVQPTSSELEGSGDLIILVVEVGIEGIHRPLLF